MTATLPDLILRPASTNVFEAVVGQLATAIRLGVFPDGTQLPPERALAEQLGVSRVTLREAIAALRDSGLVETTRGRGGGTTVTYSGRPASEVHTPDGPLPEVDDVVAFRRVVEAGAAELAAARSLSAAERQTLVDCLDATAETVGDNAHRVADARLHLAIAAACGSAMLIESVISAQAALAELLAAIPVLPRNIAHSQEQHERIVGAVLRGDPDGARAAMQEHCDATAQLLTGLLG